MKTLEDLKDGKFENYMKCVFAGEPGDGKTHLAGTFPKTYFAVMLPGEMDTILNNPALSSNLVGWDEYFPNREETEYQVFKRLEKTIDEVIYPMAKSGEIKTFVLDGLTPLAQYIWAALKTDLKASYMSNNNLFDALKAYGGLKDMLYEFLLKRVLSLPCNVIINVHMMVEDDKVLEKKRDAATPYNVSVLGSMRDILPSMVSYCFYLSKEWDKDAKSYDYFVRTNKGAGKRAKSRLALPPVIKGASYSAIKSAIDKASQVLAEAKATAEKIINQKLKETENVK